MAALFQCLQTWQETNNKRLLSTSIHVDGGKYCCIALTNPTEVVITNRAGDTYADVTYRGLKVNPIS